MAAIAATVLIFNQGDHLLAPRDVYGGTYRILAQDCLRWGITHTLVDTTSFTDIEQAVTPATKALILESPSNPLLKISDLPRICAWAKERGIITIVDNTFMTPYLQRPLEFGADIVVHSATKFLAGHSDVVAGLVVAKDRALAKRIGHIQNSLGGILGPQDSWLTMRGIKTLKVRMDHAQTAAMRIAQGLYNSGRVAAVYYPGLPEHQGHELLASQADGFGAVLSFDAGNVAMANKILAGVKISAVAVSLGSVESILSYPAKMSHAAIPQAVRYEMGITDSLLRLSVGLEDPDDLLADIFSAMS
jgi:cystathionine beta-lyase/cystathionine gamma-synthase